MPQDAPAGATPPVQGAAPFDPTQNVLNLAQSIEKMVAAAMKRQDDLRERDAAHARETRDLISGYERRLDAKDEQIRRAESERINAIRAVDVGAATILANQVAASAEALRGQVEAARQQTATGLAAALDPIQKDIQDLRRAQYETQGQKTQVVESRLSQGQLVAYALLAVAIIGLLIHFKI